MATATFFGVSELKNDWRVLFRDAALKDRLETGLSLDEMASLPFPWEAEFVQQKRLLGSAQLAGSDATTEDQQYGHDEGSLQYCHLAFHAPVITPPKSVVLGSRLDAAGSASATHCGDGGFTVSEASDDNCRIAFHGRLVEARVGDNGKAPGEAEGTLDFGTEAGQIKLFTEKLKTGVVFRVGAAGKMTGQTGETVDVFGKDLFKKETNMSPFVGMILLTEVWSSTMCRMTPVMLWTFV